jgi:hypothetical protein
MFSSSNDSDVRTPLVIARMAAAFFAFVYVIAFMMYFGSPGYGVLFVLHTTVTFVALLIFAFLRRKAYAEDIVRGGVLALSLLSIILGGIHVMNNLWDSGAVVLGLIVIGILAFMAHEAYTWEQEK